MPRMIPVAGIALATLIGLNTGVFGQDVPIPSSEMLLADNSATQNELLLFYEEADLFTATKRTTTLRKAPAIATIITADEIRNMGARNLEDVLKMVPGFGISTNEWGTHMVEVRGIRTGASEKILVMIDGHSLNRNTNGSALVYNVANKLPMENIKQVEVIRGPGSALYGNSAFVATVNIITRNAEEIDGVEVKAGGGSFDSFKGNIVGGKEIGEKFTVSGSINHYQTNGPKLAIEADNLTGTAFSLAPGIANLKAKESDAFLKVGYGDLSFRGHYQKQKERYYIGISSSLTDDSFNILENYWGELAYSPTLAEGLSANFKFFYDQYNQPESQYVKILPNGFAGSFPEGMIGKPSLKNRTFGGEIQTDWDINSDNHLIAGVSFEEMQQYDVKQVANFDPLTYADIGPLQEVVNWNIDASRSIFALYLQDEWQPIDRLNLTAGVRYDYYSDFGSTVNPRAGVVWSFLENADLKLLYGQAFRAPNFQELYNINNPVVVGNPYLKPEKVETYETALSWRLNRFFATSMNYFFSRIKDQIGWLPSTTPGQAALNTNLGKTETQGVEVEVNGAYDPDIYWKLTYAYQDPRDADTDRRLPYVPSQRASASVNYAMNKYVNLHSDVLWTGHRPRSEGDTRSEMPSYATVDLAMTLKNILENLEMQATVRNLFDQNFRDPDTYGANANLAGTGPKVPWDFPREGISIFITAMYSF